MQVGATARSSDTPQGVAASTQAPFAGAAGNALLAALPADDWQRLQPLLEPVAMPLRQTLCEAGQLQTHAYFPTTAMVSLLYVTANGDSTEFAVVGREGMVGLPLFMGNGALPSLAVVESAGEGYRVPAQVIHDEFERAGALTLLLLRFAQALMAQIAQTAVCNRYHTLDQQLCRWLLLRLDRADGGELAATHELIAELLGVRREGVTTAAMSLQRAGLISYRRGHITELDRVGLEARSCECYARVKREYDRLLPAGGPLLAASPSSTWRYR